LIYLYANDVKAQHSYIKAAKDYGYDVLEMDTIIDNHFMQHVEYKGNEVTFVRVDSDTPDNLVQKEETKESVLSQADQDKVKDIFHQIGKNLGTGTYRAKSHVTYRPSCHDHQA
jgi:molecular chaperone HtpG